MNVWSKRVIWFFGVWFLMMLESFFLNVGGVASGRTDFQVVVNFLLLFVPLFFFRDDYLLRVKRLRKIDEYDGRFCLKCRKKKLRV